MEVEWRHLSSGGNSGVFMWGSPISAPGVPFLRGIEVQVLDHGYATNYEKQNGKKSDWFTTHGDVFPIHGATMKPFGPHKGSRSFPTEERSKPSPEWNHYRIVATNGVIRRRRGLQLPQGLPRPRKRRCTRGVPEHPHQGTAHEQPARHPHRPYRPRLGSALHRHGPARLEERG
jgi:hypothetical protein